MRRALCLVAFGVAAACGGGQPRAPTPGGAEGSVATVVGPDGDRLPSGWAADAMVPRELDAHHRPPNAVVTAHVLRWRVKEDERPLYVEEAIVWASVVDRGQWHWLLLSVYRHPRERGVQANEWRLSMVAETSITGVGHFVTAPRNMDVKSFLKSTHWRHGMTGFRELGSGVCPHAWQLAMDTPPDE